jgi:hypothetical protein
LVGCYNYECFVWKAKKFSEVITMDYGLVVVLGLFVVAMAAVSYMFNRMMKE